jgi:Holliday junction resolvasome RuvABC endonuclease subunit
VNVFGLDLSITATGLAPDGTVTETVGGPARDGDHRLITIRNRVRYHLRRTRYNLAVMEGPGFNSTRLFAVAMVHGIVRPELLLADVPVALVAPGTLHAFATGDGAATKTMMMQSASGLAGRTFADDNQADAWWLRRMGLAALGDRDGLNDDQIGVLGRVPWPGMVSRWAGMPSPTSDVAQCGHKTWCLRNGDHWLHAFTLSTCGKPPKNS